MWKSRMILAFFRHTNDTAGHSELSSTVILRCNVFYSVNLQGWDDIQGYTLFMKYLNHDRCTR